MTPKAAAKPILRQSLAEAKKNLQQSIADATAYFNTRYPVKDVHDISGRYSDVVPSDSEFSPIVADKQNNTEGDFVSEIDTTIRGTPLSTTPQSSFKASSASASESVSSGAKSSYVQAPSDASSVVLAKVVEDDSDSTVRQLTFDEDDDEAVDLSGARDSLSPVQVIVSKRIPKTRTLDTLVLLPLPAQPTANASDDEVQAYLQRVTEINNHNNALIAQNTADHEAIRAADQAEEAQASNVTNDLSSTKSSVSMEQPDSEDVVVVKGVEYETGVQPLAPIIEGKRIRRAPQKYADEQSTVEDVEGDVEEELDEEEEEELDIGGELELGEAAVTLPPTKKAMIAAIRGGGGKNKLNTNDPDHLLTQSLILNASTDDLKGYMHEWAKTIRLNQNALAKNPADVVAKRRLDEGILFLQWARAHQKLNQ